MKTENNNLIIKISIFVSIFAFVSFGLFHLTKFETTDEHFWKYDRIEKYYNGLKEGFESGRWNKTRINDKPGVTNALISGITIPILGLEPSKHNDIEGEKNNRFYDEKKGKYRELYDMYHTENTEKINLALRLPGLLFNAFIILPIIFWLTLKIIKNKFLASINALLIGMNPIMIGVSQIVNPDTFLWGFSAIGLLSYIAYLYRDEKKFIIISGLATGFALLSKYSANLLFAFYPILFILLSFFENKKKGSNRELIKDFKKFVFSFVSITFIAFIVFSLFMPEVLIERKHFLYGTLYSSTLAPLVDIFINVLNLREIIFYTESKYRTMLMFPFSLAVFILVFIFFPYIVLWLMQKIRKCSERILRGFIFVMLFIFAFSFVNAWFNTPFFSLENIKEESRESGRLVFPDFASDPSILFWTKALMAQAQNLIFSLSPIIVLFILFLWIQILRGKVFHKKFLPVIYLFSAIAPLIFFVGALVADIFVNIRYAIMLFPMFAFLGMVGIGEFVKVISRKYTVCKKHRKYIKYLVVTFIILTQVFTLWKIKPYYFNYHSILLPKNYVVTDSWGYGAYEAATYINSLPGASELVVWTDHRGACQFLVGKCIVSNELYLDETNVDYFIFSRRGMITKKFKSISSKPHNINPNKYYNDEEFIEKNTVFRLNIGDRPANFIKVVKVEK